MIASAEQLNDRWGCRAMRHPLTGALTCPKPARYRVVVKTWDYPACATHLQRVVSLAMEEHGATVVRVETLIP